MLDFPDILPDVKEFISKILGPSSGEVGLWLGEKVRFLRLKSSIKVFNKAREILNEAGFSEPKPVELKTLVPLLEYCSLENEDKNLIERWAGLLASACSSGLKLNAYPYILNQLSSNEVRFLDSLYENYDNTISELNSISDNNFNKISIHVDNLIRLGLCRSLMATHFESELGEYEVFYKYVQLTPLGRDFIKACKGPDRI